MKTSMRFVSLLFLSSTLLLAATPMMAACRAETILPIGQVINLNASTLTRTGPKSFSVHIVLQSTQGFRCGGDGGALPLPPGCTTDGISYKANFSTNIASAVQTADCTTFSVTETTQGQAIVAFRIRYEENKRNPMRLTFGIPVDLSSAFVAPTNLTVAPRVIADPIE